MAQRVSVRRTLKPGDLARLSCTTAIVLYASPGDASSKRAPSGTSVFNPGIVLVITDDTTAPEKMTFVVTSSGASGWTSSSWLERI